MTNQFMANRNQTRETLNRPPWIKVKLNTNDSFRRIKELNQRLGLKTVCQEAACPNIGTCWAKTEVTYILLGKNCTRNCRFCNVTRDVPEGPDASEPERIAQAIKELELDYVVLTSVSRDDLADKGVSHFLKTLSLTKDKSPQVKIEILIPDFANSPRLLKLISGSVAVVIAHNIETVPDIYPRLRPDSSYTTSLGVLKSLKTYNPLLITKSALLLGFGENEPQILKTLKDLKRTGIDIIYLGQYLSPTKQHWPVKKYYTPEEFSYFKEVAVSLGFRSVISEPLARSSWRAKEAYRNAIQLAVNE